MGDNESLQCPGGSGSVKRQLGLEAKAGGCLEHLLRGHGDHQEGGPTAAGSRSSKSPTSRLFFTYFPRSISISPKPSVKSCKSWPGLVGCGSQGSRAQGWTCGPALPPSEDSDGSTEEGKRGPTGHTAEHSTGHFLRPSQERSETSFEMSGWIFSSGIIWE